MNEIERGFEYGYQFLLLKPQSKSPERREWQKQFMDPHELAWWLRQDRRFNLGVLMRAPRGPPLLVVDRDSRDKQTWDWLRKNRLRSPMEVETCSGNWHVYMRLPEGVTDVRTRIKFLGMPVDLLMGDRYCVFPPSIVGKPYKFRDAKGLVPIDQLPVFPVEILKEPVPQRKTFSEESRLASNGIRNVERYVLKIESHQGSNGSAGLVRAVIRMKEAGRSAQQTFEYLSEVWNKEPRVTPPWSHEEIARCVSRFFGGQP